MPSLIRPPDMPEDVVQAIETMGNRARTEILRELITHGPLTTQEIAERIGATRIAARAHLLAMEEAGVVAADVPASTRPGRVVHWSAEGDRAEALAATWADYVTGRSGQGS